MMNLEEAHPTDELEGIRVNYWTTPQDTARMTGVSTRTLARHEDRGLPARGSGRNKRYAWPHAAWWLHAWNHTPPGTRWVSMARAAEAHWSLVASLENDK